MDRRSFLKLAGGGVVVAAAGSGLFLATRTPAKALAPWQAAGAAQYSDPRMRALSFAILAPNPHNRQPWIAELVDDDTINTFFDTERTLPATDPFDRQLTIGMGCFLELLELAAGADGHRTETNLFPDGYDAAKLDTRPVARIRLIADESVSPDPLFAHVLERRSMKEAHDMTRPVPERALETLAAAARNGTQVGGTVAAPDLPFWRDLTERAMALEIDTPRTFKESVDLFRIGKSEINANPDGIELGGAMMDIMRATGLMTREASMDPTSTAFTQGREITLAPLRTTMGMVWMVTAANDRLSQIAAGRDWLRMNVAATSIGLGFHPNSQALQEYPEMSSIYDDVHDRLAPDGGRVQMLARIGYGENVGPTPRWPLESRLRRA